MFISNVCRAELPKHFTDSITTPGVHVIPTSVLEPRQVKINPVEEGPQRIDYGVKLKTHRGELIPTITRTAANELVNTKGAVWEEQSLLVYSMNDYLVDPDVQNDPSGEYVKTIKADLNGEQLVAVAVIGGARSALSVCRNIVSGCQDSSKLVEDAQKALDASHCILVED